MSTCKQKNSSLTQNIIEVPFYTATILMLLSSFQNIGWKDLGNHGYFLFLFTSKPCCKNCASSRIPQGNFVNVGATRPWVALWIWMTSNYFLAADYLTVWEGFLLKAMKKQGRGKHKVNYSSKFIQQITVSIPWIQIISLIFCTKKGDNGTDLQLIFHFSKILWCSCPNSQYVQNQCT